MSDQATHDPGNPIELERAVDIATLRELARSCRELFSVPIRLFSVQGELLAEEYEQAAICELINQTPTGRKACADLVAKVQRASASATEPITIACFTGARYDILPLQQAGEPAGRLVVGPYRMQGDAADGSAPGDHSVPDSLARLDSRLDLPLAGQRLAQMVRLEADLAGLLRSHLRLVLEAVVSSGYAAVVTSAMHVAATRESYHQLKVKNAELQDAHDRLKELDGLKSSFLSTVSHELRTPLTSILGYADMLLNDMAGPLQAEQREFLGTIQRQGERLLKLIRTLLDMTRLEKGNLPMERREVKLRTVLADVVTTLTPVAIDKGVYLDLALGKDEGHDVPPIGGDADRLHQVFLNLVENAVKFSAPGGYVSISTTLGEAADSEQVGYILFAPLQKNVEVRIADNGPGIPTRSRTRVFDAFYQLDHPSTREHAGTGLGLAIVKRIVDGHGGSIHVEDNSPQGAVFVVRLPLWTGPA